MPGEGLTHGPPAERKRRRQSPQDQPNIRHSLRDGFTASSALSPGTGFIAPVIARRKCVVASATMLAHCARHQHRDARTTRLGRPHKRVRRRPPRTLRARTATAPRLALRDDRDAPLSPRRDAEDITRFLEKRKRNFEGEARQATSIEAPPRSALQAFDLAPLKTREQPMLRLASSSSTRPSAHQRKPSVLAGDNVHGCKRPRSARNQNAHRLMSHWHQPFVLAVLSRAARKPLASLMASSLAQKCMKNSRGCSSNI
jgi:hypothetical protein